MRKKKLSSLKKNLKVKSKIKAILGICNKKSNLFVNLLSIKPSSLITNSLISPAKSQPSNNKDRKTQLVFQKNYKTELKLAKKLILTSINNILQLIIVEKIMIQKI